MHWAQALPRDRDWPRALSAALSALLVGALAFAAAQTARLGDANARLRAMVEKAFYETCELTEGLSVNLRKLQVAGETGRMQALLNETALQTQGALSNLALLPLGQETVSATLKFINQTGDFSASLAVKLAEGGEMTPADRRTLSALADRAAAFSSDMGQLLERYERGEAILDGGAPADGEGLSPITDPAGEYPVLLYDGPFSDGREGGAFRALEGLEPVTQAQARAALARFVGCPEAAVTFTGTGVTPVACYEFTARRGEVTLSAGVTKAGGRVLYLLPDSAPARENLSTAQAAALARDFLARQGFGDMEMSYASRFEGLLTVNFAAVQDGVVLYPDLVKVQISLEDGAVLGLEAANYLMNHVPRSLSAPALTESDALQRIGGALNPRRVRLCVIPEDGGEALCYEITADDGEDTFLVYIDAQTGRERQLMQVIGGEGVV